MTNTTELMTWLTTHGFTNNPNAELRDIYDSGTARVLVEDAAGGAITVYRFTADRARLLEWEADFRHAPTPLIIFAVQAALATQGRSWSGTLGRYVSIPD